MESFANDTQPLNAVSQAVLSLNITDPNLFRAARAPGTRSLFDALKSEPISDVVRHPAAMPVSTAPQADLIPIFDHLIAGRPATDASFPRGATFTDGRLDMCKQVVGPEWIGDLTDAVRQGGAQSGVSHFLLGNNVVGDTGADAIARMLADPDSAQIETLYLAGNAFSAAGARSLCAALVDNKKVTSLWLKRNPLGPDGAKYLGEMLAQNTTLQVLDLVNTGLLDDGVEALFDGLAVNRSLRVLYLDANGLGPRAARAIARYFDGLKARGEVGLTTLFIGINRLGCEGAGILAKGLKGYPHLHGLDLGANRIEGAGLDAILSMAVTMPQLKCLELGLYKSASDMGELPNWFGDHGAAKIASYLDQTSGLSVIKLNDTHIGGDGLALLGDALENKHDIFEMTSAQYGLKVPGLITRIERYLDRNVRAAFGYGLRSYRAGPLRDLRHGPDIPQIDSIYRNVM